MGRIVKRNQPCRNPQCGSSDAMQIYEDNSAHCFSCGKTFRNVDSNDEPRIVKRSDMDKIEKELAEIAELPTRGFKSVTLLRRFVSSLVSKYRMTKMVKLTHTIIHMALQTLPAIRSEMSRTKVSVV